MMLWLEEDIDVAVRMRNGHCGWCVAGDGTELIGCNWAYDHDRS